MNPVPKPGWLLGPTEPANAPTIPAGTEYHRVLAGDSRRIGRGIAAILLLAAGLVGFPTLIGQGLALIDVRLGNDPAIAGGEDYTPLQHAGAMFSLALLLPWSMLIQRWLYKVPGASLHSVISRFRFDLFGKSLLVFGPAWLLVIVLGFLAPSEQVPWTRGDLIAFFVVTVLLTPLQTTGEEYGVHGLLLRVAGSWTRGAKAGLIVAVLVVSVLFTAVHGSTDPYIITWYLVLWAGLSIITWRTGGLEIAVMLHAVLNTISFLVPLSLRVDLGGALSDRSAGVGSPYQLVPAAAVIVITAIVWWCTRKTGPALTVAATAAPRRR